MKRLSLFPVLLIALLVGGCPRGAGLGDLVAIATTDINNPVTPTNIYQVKLAYAASQELVVKYQRDCFGSDMQPYPVTLARIRADATLSVQCAHRVSRYKAAKEAEGKANAAILVADDFIAHNPNGNAASYIAAAWRAVSDYRAKVGG